LEHSFDIEIAKEYGIHEAIILKNIYFWVEKNRANEKHFYEGRYWTYNSKKAFSELFPYLNERQVKYALEKMKKEGLILTGNFNDTPYDRTCWYALTDKAFKLLKVDKKDPEPPENTDKTKLSNGEDKSENIDQTKLSNGENKIVQPIPDSKPDSKHSKKEISKEKKENKKSNKFIPPTVEEVKEYCKEHNYRIDPEMFVAYYESNGWITGKVKMKNWQASVRYWASKNKKGNKQDEPETSYNVQEYEEMTQEEIFKTLGVDI
jgi:hypothetical protein